MIGRRSQKDAQLSQVEEDFTAVTLPVHWIEFLDKRDKPALPMQNNKAMQGVM